MAIRLLEENGPPDEMAAALQQNLGNIDITREPVRDPAVSVIEAK